MLKRASIRERCSPSKEDSLSSRIIDAVDENNKMYNALIIDTIKLTEQLARFTAFVHQMDGKSGSISFRDSTGFLGRKEDYKSRIAEEARAELKLDDWQESWIGSGKIAACAMKAMSKAGNLVNKNQQIDFKNRLNPENPK